MSVIDKQLFANEFKERLSDKLTTKDANTVIAELVEQMSSYELGKLAEVGNTKEFEDMIELYCNSLLVAGRSENTIKRYRYKLRRFMNYDKTPIRQMTVFNIRQFLAYEKSRGIKDTTLRGDRDIYHAFFGWLHREGLLPYDPCSNLSPVKKKKEKVLPFSDVELEKIKSTDLTTRDKAVISFLLSTGCRISEVVALNRKDIDFQNMEVKVLGKGNKERIVYFTNVTSMYLEEYLAERKDDSEALFAGKGTDRLKKGAYEKRLRQIGDQAGVKKVHPHRFRHTFATNLIDNGMPIQEVSVLMGHERIDTTQQYVYTDQRRVENSYRKYA